MVKEKRTKLHVWQKPISEEEYMKKIKADSKVVGYFATTKQFYETDMSNPEYIKHRAEKEAKKKLKREKHMKFVEKRIASARKQEKEAISQVPKKLARANKIEAEIEAKKKMVAELRTV
jgi:hypothetical protein